MTEPELHSVCEAICRGELTAEEIDAAFPDQPMTAEEENARYESYLEDRIVRLENELRRVDLALQALETFSNPNAH